MPERTHVASPRRRGAARTAAALLLLAAGGALAAPGCRGGSGAGGEAPPPPLAYEGRAYDLAGERALPARQAEDLPGLHHVYRLSDDVISGAEPVGEEAFATLRSLGVRTVLSVDGKTPDADAAERHGLRYVHVPIQYKGITPEELGAIAKTFRELPGPFYVHCFHGKHRGPAAAAVGRLVLDGAAREEALAEMRQWCGTSADYEGLYAAVAAAPIPDASATGSLDFDFPPAHPMQGVRGVMIPVPRAHDALKAMAERAWAIDPGHPDADAAHEAEILHDLFTELAKQPQARKQPADFQGWLAEATAASAELQRALAEGRDGLAPDDPLTGPARERADAAFATLSADCRSCHAVYRD